MTEPDAAEENARAAYERIWHLAQSWDYESWEAEHLRDKAGQFSWMAPQRRSLSDATVEDGGPSAD